MRFAGFLGSFWLGEIIWDASVTCRDDLNSLRFPKHISNMICHPFLGFYNIKWHPKILVKMDSSPPNCSKRKDQSSLKLAPGWMDSSNFFRTFSLRIMNKNTISHFPTHQVGPYETKCIRSHIPSKYVVLYGLKSCPWQGGDCIHLEKTPSHNGRIVP